MHESVQNNGEGAIGEHCLDAVRASLGTVKPKGFCVYIGLYELDPLHIVVIFFCRLCVFIACVGVFVLFCFEKTQLSKYTIVLMMCKAYAAKREKGKDVWIKLKSLTVGVNS